MRFRFVDRILSFGDGPRIHARKAVSFEEYRLLQPFGGVDEVPSSLLVESLLQAGQWLVIACSDFERLALVVRMARISLPRSVHRGQSVTIEVAVRSINTGGIMLEGRGTVDGYEVIRGEGCLATLAQLSDYENPADLRVLYSEIAPGVQAPVLPELFEAVIS